jgi:hypothetical protein
MGLRHRKPWRRLLEAGATGAQGEHKLSHDRGAPAAVMPSLVGGGGVLDGRTMAGRMVEPETNCDQQRHDDEDDEQQSGNI